MMEPIVIQLNEQAGLTRHAEPIRFGVPLPQGLLATTDTLRLTGNDQVYPLQATVTGRWHDGSIRWLLVESLIDLTGGNRLELLLTESPTVQPLGPSIAYTTRSDGISIDTGPLHVLVDPHQLSWRPLEQSTPSGTAGRTEVTLTDRHGKSCISRLEKWEVISSSTEVCLELRAQGDWLDQNQRMFARFDCRLRFYQGSETVAADVCLHNPRRARHPGGLWDLGDPGSIQFQSLGIDVQTDRQINKTLKTELHGPFHSFHNEAPMILHQDSSGGDQWHSRNHIDANGKVTTRFRGYQIRTGEEVLAQGDRANPILSVETSGHSYHLSMRQFWQNFPSALQAETDKIGIALFPAESGPYELQGGERKTHTCFLNYGTQDDCLNWTQAPLVPILPAKVYERANVFPWFTADQEPGPLDALIKEGLDGPNNFFAKRETIDEYGWRNFGDIFADHETLYQEEGEEPYISHYNNQYDAIYGFARQFALTGDPRWFELMDDLARHVTDIDIYHTEEDRVEYNNGLFWHTDHYLDAHTSTHRTFSRHNTTSSNPGQAGGGPAAEHCYSTGLLYHYYLTGNSYSGAAVTELADWMIRLHEGPEGLMAQLLSLKKTEVSQLKQLITGGNPSPYRYPFTRGTGNYINVLLSAFSLGGRFNYLRTAEQVIQQTLHPADKIAQRDLGNVEAAWSYLVCLNALASYLEVKAALCEKDSTYQYAKAAFLSYARWMAEHEEPFMEQASALEFPNDTWVAQDIRKAMLMFIAEGLDSAQNKKYKSKGDEWFNYVVQTLQNSKTSYYARIQVILLQNYGPHVMKDSKRSADSKHSKVPNSEFFGIPPKFNKSVLALNIFKKIVKGLMQFSPKRERDWLYTRLNRP